MISAKEIVNKCMETKREEVKQTIIDAVKDEFEGKALCYNIVYVHYMDDTLQKELEEAEYTVKQKRDKKILGSEIYWEISWNL